jgi:phage-related protein
LSVSLEFADSKNSFSTAPPWVYLQFGWPIGMPLVRKLETGLWEVRVDLPSGIARILFTVFEGDAVLLHGFIKKSEKTPLPDLKTARQRKKLLK